MGRPRKQRRNPHGSAWHWKQTDCWYYTLPGTKKRVALFDENGGRIRGRANQDAAGYALARAKLSGEMQGTTPVADQAWIVARVCSEYLQYCERSAAAGSMSRGHRDQSVSFLNDLCIYFGALPVAELKKNQVQTWIDGHAGCRSPATQRSVIAIVLAAFNRAEEMLDVPNPLKGLKKPQSQPRLQSLSPEEEQTLYEATEETFRNFLFAAIHTGLRPYCELAKLTADHVEVSDRGMMWRVYSSKTKKTRKIPIHKDVAKLVHRLMLTAPKGSGKPLFRNTRDEPWKRMTGVVRFSGTEEKTGLGSRPGEEQVFELHLPTHVRASHVVRLLERRRRMFDRNAGRADRRRPQSRSKPEFVAALGVIRLLPPSDRDTACRSWETTPFSRIGWNCSTNRERDAVGRRRVFTFRKISLDEFRSSVFDVRHGGLLRSNWLRTARSQQPLLFAEPKFARNTRDGTFVSLAQGFGRTLSAHGCG